MKFEDFEKHFSPSRIDRYLIATGGDQDKTTKLYKSNLQLGQALHPMLGILEVVLRNEIDNRLSKYFNDSNWIINQKGGFMSDRSLLSYKGGKPSNGFLYNSVLKAEENIKNRKGRITSGRVIAEQTFGFWTDLFATNCYKVLKGEPIKIFRFLPPGYNRKEIHEDLNKVRTIRNRINHNEPICFIDNRIDLTEVRYAYQSIVSMLNWIDPEITVFLNELDKVSDAIADLEKI